MTTDALVSTLHSIHTSLDRGNVAVRVLFTDFTKGFDLIDHNILVEKLDKLKISTTLIKWIIAFLTNRKQRVKISGVYSNWEYLNGGIPKAPN